MGYVMPWHISKKYLNTAFSATPTLDDKIELFRDRVTGWQIEIAEEMLSKIPDSGYGAISVLFSYFEMMAEILKGTPSNSASKIFFGDGYKAVYPMSPLTSPEIELVHSQVRCGMYHSGFTKPGTQIGSAYPEAVSVVSGYVFINPHKLVADIKAHFERYIKLLMNPANGPARSKFETMFDHGVATAPPLPPSLLPSAPPTRPSPGPQALPPGSGGGPPPSGTR
jgi:hypothetical protein